MRETPTMDKPKRMRKPKMGSSVASAAASAAESEQEPEIQQMRGVSGFAALRSVSPSATLGTLVSPPTLQSLLEMTPSAKQRKKPRMGEAFSTTSSETSVKRKPKMKVKPEESVREVVLPTHQEQEQEEVDADGFDIEYVTVKVVEINGMEYFCDKKKNKLFRKIKEKSVGNYVGRYDPRTETILELPDSDSESV